MNDIKHHPTHNHSQKKPDEQTENKEAESESTEQENPKKSKQETWKNNLKVTAMALVLTGILLALVIVPNVLKKNQIESDKYNNFEFIQREDNLWYTVVNKGDQPYHVPFYYHPRELEDIIVEENLRDKFFDIQKKKGIIYITIDPESENNKIVIAGVEIARITGDRYGLLNVVTKSALTKMPSSTSVNTQTPVKTCNDANNQTLVIWLVVTDKNLVTTQGNCIIAQAATYEETVMVADRMMYHLMGIMN